MQLIPVAKLKLDTSNPRHEKVNNQNDAIIKIFDREQDSMVEIAKDIHDYGLDPTLGFWVMPEDDRFIVLEGNRRLSSIFCIMDPSRAPEEYRGDFERIISSGIGKTPREINCVIVASREEARRWIKIRHTKGNSGLSISSWNPEQQARFDDTGEVPDDKTLQIIDWMKRNAPKAYEGYSKKGDMFTNLERLLNDPSFREAIGLEYRDSVLYSRVHGNTLAAIFERVVSDFNSGKNVNDIRKKDDRRQYVSSLSSVLPKSADVRSSSTPLNETIVVNQRVAVARRAIPTQKKQSTLIAGKAFNFSCSNNRIMAIVGELKKLKVNEFPNATSMLLRAFIEMSTYHYGRKASVPGIKTGQGNFESDWDKVIAFMVANGELDQNQAKAVRKLAKSPKDYMLSYDTLHQCVHNKDFSITEQDIFRIWATVEGYLASIGKKGV